MNQQIKLQMRKKKINEIKRQIGRKILHLIIGLLLIAGYYFEIYTPFQLFLFILFSGAISLVQRYYTVPIVNWLVETFGKSEEKNFPGKGFILMLMGFLITIKLYSKDIALASLTILVIGDPLTHLLSQAFPIPKLKIKKPKTIFGIILSILITTLITSYFVPIKLAFFGTLTALLFETFEVKIEEQILDDNIMIPIVSGTTMLILKR